jgi:DUF1680 family protein
MRGGEGLAAVARDLFYTGDQSVYVLSFENASVNLKFKNDSLVLIEKTGYPFKGGVIFEVKETSLSFNPRIKLLAPSWVNDPGIFINGKKMNSDLENGFICFSATLKKGDRINYAFTLRSVRKGVENPNSMKGYHKYFSGPLLPGQVGNGKTPLTPVYHLLDPQVKKETGYQIQILFKK